MTTVQHPLQPVQPRVDDPEEVVAGTQEVGEEGEHGDEVDDEEELGVGDDALVEEAVHVAVEERPEDARDGGVRGEEREQAADCQHLERVRVRVRVRVRPNAVCTSAMVR